LPNFRISICILSCIVLAILVVPVSAIEYNVGVVPGNYVKYGNFSGSAITSYNDFDWAKYEITEVSGKNVTLLMTAMYKNRTAAVGSGSSSVYNLEKGTVNGYNSGISPIMGSNLNQGDPLPFSFLNISRTESRVYLCQSRTVNILEQNSTYPDNITGRILYVFDRASGMALEAQMEMTNATGTFTAAFSVIETNIFAASTTNNYPTPSPTSNPTPTLSSSPTPVLSSGSNPSPSTEPSPSIPEFASLATISFLIAATILTAILYKGKRNRLKQG
jgi:hypothetical protein